MNETSVPPLIIGFPDPAVLVTVIALLSDLPTSLALDPQFFNSTFLILYLLAFAATLKKQPLLLFCWNLPLFM
ncbi:MAG: hypothetical protein NC204_00775 [Candidatus Amulumruptor caecigallinarius]|nr:hypothetical protein [Candidatus Amulumruptor caecigallinarius]